MTVTFILKPGTLTLKTITGLVYSKTPIALDTSADVAIERSFTVVQDVVRKDQTVYGINTGFGLLANTKIDQADLKELQRRIILSHSCGVGQPLASDAVKAIMLLKINSLAMGYSGVSRELIDALIALYNHQVIPQIPEKGSVGASGDLAPLAHMSMVLIGEGTAEVNGKIVDAKTALAHAGLTPLTLKEKEGLALINGTQVSTAIALVGLIKVQRNFALATLAGALTLDAVKGSVKPFRAFIAKAKKCEGQLHFSEVVKDLLQGSEILESHQGCCDKVQDPYSIRCQPQVMGAVWESITDAKRHLVNEANGVSDNPLICPESGEIISGGNFHAERSGLCADALAIACSEIGAISERRIALLTDKNLSGLPPFLVDNPGLNSGFMLPHVTASALASENKTLCHPATVDSLPTSANQEDHVSMATYAARKMNTVADNVFYILVIETLAACQGLDFRAPLKTSEKLQRCYNAIRRSVSFYDQDRYFAADIEKAVTILSDTVYYADVESVLFGE